MDELTPYSPERRSAERFRVSLPVETDRGFGVTRDVSLSGLYLVTDERLSPGDDLDLVVGLAESGGSFPFRLALRGKVVRVEAAGGAVGAAVAVDEESARLLKAS
jgi:hypothetical protein